MVSVSLVLDALICRKSRIMMTDTALLLLYICVMRGCNDKLGSFQIGVSVKSVTIVGQEVLTF